MHKIPRGTSINAKNPTRNFQLHLRKMLVGFFAYLEVSLGNLCIFGSSSWDFVHFWKFFVGFCAVWFAMRKFQKCTKSHEELPKMHKMI
jgi:uncharacterized membrane protein YuzA (DUF378 family)